MKFIDALKARWSAADTPLCVGLDPDPGRFPNICAPRGLDLRVLHEDRRCNRRVCLRVQAADCLLRISGCRRRVMSPDCVYPRHASGRSVILDAKRGDMASTAQHYAREVFERYNAHAVTLSPYLGFDSIEPYLAYADRGVFLLCRTSNRRR